MSLSSSVGRAPFQPDTGGTSSPRLPAHVRYWEPWPRRMRAVRAGRTVLDSRRGLIFWETDAFAQLFYPRDDIDVERLSVDDLVTGPTDRDGGETLPGYLGVSFGAMDAWYEEDQPVYAHPRDPYHRIDTLASSRRVVVSVDGEVIAESDRPKLVFETGLPPRHYVPFDDVVRGVLSRSDTVTQCPYKGDGQHWHVAAGSAHIADAAWSLPHPRPEAIIAEQHVCFYPDKVRVEVDGELLQS